MELSNEQYQELVSNLADGVLIVDESGEILYETPSIQQMTGYTPDERVGGHVFEHVHPDDQQMVRETFSEILESEGDRIVTTEFRYRHKDGSWIWLKTRGRNQSTTAIGGYVVSVSDITETKERVLDVKLLFSLKLGNCRSYMIGNTLRLAFGINDYVYNVPVND